MATTLFPSIFNSLISSKVTIKVELKNGVEITGTLDYVDANLNFNLANISVDLERYPQFLCMKDCFIRGSSIRYVHVPPNEIDTSLIQDTCRREFESTKP